MLNGAVSHALDYDDTHFAHIGHLSVGIYAAALAVGEQNDKSLNDVVDAYLLGAESAIRVGLHLGRQHYDKGFHQTATSGAFGATIAAARLLDLGVEEKRAAIGLCSTRASGLRNQFGTMGKPLNAGYASSTGVECSALAKQGLTSADDGLEGLQGFFDTHTDTISKADGQPPLFKYDEISFKFHACCHGTHAMLQALRDLKASGDVLDGKHVEKIEVRTNPRWLKVCDLKKPRTGLEVKFSYAWLAAMFLSGVSTSDPLAFDDACARDPVLGELASRVTVLGDTSLSDMQSKVSVSLVNGKTLMNSFDLSSPLSFREMHDGLMEKAEVIIGSKARDLDRMIFVDGTTSAKDFGAFLCHATSESSNL